MDGVLTPGLTLLDLALDPEISARSPLNLAWHRLNRTLDTFVDRQMTAA